jgi:hypothetical protein
LHCCTIKFIGIITSIPSSIAPHSHQLCPIFPTPPCPTLLGQPLVTNHPPHPLLHLLYGWCLQPSLILSREWLVLPHFFEPVRLRLPRLQPLQLMMQWSSALLIISLSTSIAQCSYSVLLASILMARLWICHYLPIV